MTSESFPTEIVPYGALKLLDDLSIRISIEGGVNYIRLNNGARVTFSSCSLSENGTSLQRGQIPYFLYSIVDTEKSETTEVQEEVGSCFRL